MDTAEAPAKLFCRRASQRDAKILFELALHSSAFSDFGLEKPADDEHLLAAATDLLSLSFVSIICETEEGIPVGALCLNHSPLVCRVLGQELVAPEALRPLDVVCAISKTALWTSDGAWPEWLKAKYSCDATNKGASEFPAASAEQAVSEEGRAEGEDDSSSSEETESAANSSESSSEADSSSDDEEECLGEKVRDAEKLAADVPNCQTRLSCGRVVTPTNALWAVLAVCGKNLEKRRQPQTAEEGASFSGLLTPALVGDAMMRSAFASFEELQWILFAKRQARLSGKPAKPHGALNRQRVFEKFGAGLRGNLCLKFWRL